MENLKAKYTIDGTLHIVEGTSSALYIQLDLLLDIYGSRFKFLGVA